jgi:thiol-disulfide isomerase/thioredoxin
LKEVVQGNPKVIVKAGLSYCAPCKQVQPTFEQVAETLTDYVCVQVVADEVEGSAGFLKAKGVPLFVRFENAEQKRRMIGNLSYDELVKITDY